jgi:hypothetical protein
MVNFKNRSSFTFVSAMRSGRIRIKYHMTRHYISNYGNTSGPGKSTEGRNAIMEKKNTHVLQG